MSDEGADERDSEQEPMRVQAFVRRLKRLVADQGARVVFFLGAGCSKDAGVPTAGELVQEWLRQHAREHHGGLDDWEGLADYADDVLGHKIDADISDGEWAKAYSDVIEEVFPSRAERQREMQDQVQGVDPTFGYSVLARLMTHGDEFEGAFNVVLTVNFDDLVADALYLWTHEKPLVTRHEALADYVGISDDRPYVVKLHGDARVSPQNTDDETDDVAQNYAKILPSLLEERVLVFAGYGGNDDSIASALAAATRQIGPPGDDEPSELPWGVYWVGSSLPDGPVRDWLDTQGTTWVEHRDFERLMTRLWGAFDLGDWEPTERFEDLKETYADGLSEARQLAQVEEDPAAKREIEEAVDEAEERFDSWWSVHLEAQRFLDDDKPEKARDVYEGGLDAFERESGLHNGYANLLKNEFDEFDKARKHYERALEINPETASPHSNYASLLLARGQREAGLDHLARALAHAADNRQDRKVRQEALFFTFVRVEEARNASLARLKWRLQEERETMRHLYAAPHIDWARDNHPEPKLVEALAAAIKGKIDIADLDDYEAWAEVEPVEDPPNSVPDGLP